MKVEFPFWIGEPPYRQLMHDAKQLAQYVAERGGLETPDAFANRKMTFDRADFKGLSMHQKWRRLFEDACTLPLKAEAEWRRLVHVLRMRSDRTPEIQEVLRKGEWRSVDLTDGSAWMKRSCKELDWPAAARRSTKLFDTTFEGPTGGTVDADGLTRPELFGRVVPSSLLVLGDHFVNIHGDTEKRWHVNVPKLLRLAGFDDAELCVFEQRLQERTRDEVLADALLSGGEEWRKELQAAWRRMARKAPRLRAILDQEIAAEKDFLLSA